MKKSIKLVLLTIIMLSALVLLTGCGSEVLNQATQEKEDTLEGLAVYTAEETPDYTTFSDIEGVEFKYPSNYKSIGKESLPMFMDPDVAGATVNIVTSELPSVLTFEGYVDASIPGIKAQMDIEGEIVPTYINLNGRKAARLDYVAVNGLQKMNITQIIINKQDKIYILTLGALQKDKEAVSEKYEKIIKSFK